MRQCCPEAQAGLELGILLSLLPGSWDEGHVLPNLPWKFLLSMRRAETLGHFLQECSLRAEPVTRGLAGGTWRSCRPFHHSYGPFKSSQRTNKHHLLPFTERPGVWKERLHGAFVRFPLPRDGCPARLPRQTINCTRQTAACGGRPLLLEGGELVFVTVRKPRAMICLPKLERINAVNKISIGS